MAGALRWSGLEEFKQELRNLPEDLRDDAGDIVLDAANKTQQDVVDAYANVTGNLDRGVKVKVEKSAFGAKAVVRSNAPHAHLYEFGSQARHTAIGANRGAMPPRPTLIPIAQRNRRAMWQRLMDLVASKGFRVTGRAE